MPPTDTRVRLTNVPRPSGSHAEEMIQGGAWPEGDEFAFLRAAQQYTTALQTLRSGTFTPWSTKQRDTFKSGGGIWSGDAAGAADNMGSTLTNAITAQENFLANAAYWNEQVANLFNSTKQKIADRVKQAQEVIEKAENKLRQLSAQDQDAVQLLQNMIKSEISGCHTQNLSDVSTAAGAVQRAGDFRPPFDTDRLVTNGLSTDLPESGVLPSTPGDPVSGAPDARATGQGTAPAAAVTPPVPPPGGPAKPPPPAGPATPDARATGQGTAPVAAPAAAVSPGGGSNSGGTSGGGGTSGSSGPAASGIAPLSSGGGPQSAAAATPGSPVGAVPSAPERCGSAESAR
jgi:hypothetical protein